MEESYNNPSSSTIRFLGILKQPTTTNNSSNPFELDESDVIWSDSSINQTPTTTAALSDDNTNHLQTRTSLNPPASSTAVRMIPIQRSGGSFLGSAPVNVPVWPDRVKKVVYDDEDDDEEMLPPHEIVARSRLTAFSVFEGFGRTLKGRDLLRVRNAVMQKTGFLD